MPECLICCEDKETMVVGRCNHPSVCLICSYKLRSLNNNAKCIVCNEELKQVILVKDEETLYEDLEAMGPTAYNFGISYTDPEERWECYALDSIKCPIKKCRLKKRFNNMNQFKKHLKEDHNRHLCDLCLKHRTLMLDEQKLYKQDELTIHMESGDFDDKENLLFFHPYCEFCKKYFFSEEEFTKHLKTEHFKCHLCNKEEYRNIYYKQYKNLETHFKMSHYACPEENCKEKCFIVFKTKAELDKHNATVHQGNPHYTVTLIGKGGQDEVIKDREGVDMTRMLLSKRKMETKVSDPVSDKKRYNGELSAIDLFEHMVTTPNATQDEERDLVFNHNRDLKRKDYKYPQVYLEEVRFTKIESKTGHSFHEFLNRAKLILSRGSEDKLKRVTSNFVKTKMSADKLFDQFQEIFGPFLVFKYLHHYSKCVKNEAKAKEISELVDYELNGLMFVKKNKIANLVSWRDFFNLIVAEISKNLFRRLETGKITPTKIYSLQKDRIGQLIGCVRGLCLQDFINFSLLNNFLRHEDSKKNLQTSLVVPIKRSDGILDRIKTKDLLVMFLYFNIGTMKFEGKSLTKSNKHNPNLLKIFLRHYPKVAKDYNYKLKSDDEDYEEVHTKDKAEREMMKNKEKKVEKVGKYDNLAKEDVLLVKDDDHLDIENKYDFPTLETGKKKSQKEVEEKEKEKEKNAIKRTVNGWGATLNVVYQNEATKKKALAEEFPSLGNDEEEEARTSKKGDLFSRMHTNKKQADLDKKFNKLKFQKQTSQPGERNLLAEISAKPVNKDLFIIKKKKKKKRGK